MGIGPTRPAWKAGILPLNYTRISHTSPSYRQRLYIIALLQRIVKYFSTLFLKKCKKNLILFFLTKSVKNCDYFSWKKFAEDIFRFLVLLKKICYNNEKVKIIVI